MVLDGILSVITSPLCLGLIFGGVIIGIIFGSIPGLSATMAMVLFLPLTFSLTSVNGMALLIGLYVGGISGGLISAILLKIPGTPSSITTVFDGGPMAERGEGAKAIAICIMSSFIGGVLSLIALIFLSPVLADVALKFTAFEYATIILFALVVVGTLTGENPILGLISAAIGVLLATVGTAPVDHAVRFDFGIKHLATGFDVVAMMIGFFAVNEVLAYAFNYTHEERKPRVKTVKISNYGMKLTEWLHHTRLIIQSAIIGIVVGVLPGIGGDTAALMSYSAAKTTSKHPEEFGKGCTEGIVASEVSNNATIGGVCVPMLTLGIPGSTAAAVLMSGLILQGVTPGPMIFKTQGTLVYGIFAAMLVANVVMVIVERAMLPGFIKVLTVPKGVLFPIVIALCAIGCYTTNHLTFDVICMFIFGVIGYFTSKFGIPTAPALIAYILGPLFEQYFRTGLINSRGDWSPFFTSPICIAFIILTVLFCVIPILQSARKKKATT